MEWFQLNWFWLFVIVMFICMQMGGHRHGDQVKSGSDEPPTPEKEGIGPVDHDHPGGGHHAQH